MMGTTSIILMVLGGAILWWAFTSSDESHASWMSKFTGESASE